MLNKLILAWLAALILAGCQTNPYAPVPEELGMRIRVYEDIVRWGALQKIHAFRKPQLRETIEIPENLDNVRVTHYEVNGTPVEVAPLRWRQTATIQYVLTDRQIVKTLVDEQVWGSDDGKTWYRLNPIPAF